MSPAICSSLIEVDCTGEVTVVRLAGQLVSLNESRALDLSQELLDLVDQGHHHLALDLGNVHFLTSTMIEGLLEVHRGLKKVGGWLSISNLSPAVAEMFSVLCLYRVFDSGSMLPSF